MLTCYDYSFAKILDEAQIDMILVGDSLANVVLGMDEIRNVSLSEMFRHTKAVAKGVKNTLVVADMPYLAYQGNPRDSLKNARKFIGLGAGAVKIEWYKDCVKVIKRIVKSGIPVMGHIGLTPQTADLLGGFKVQGKTKDAAKRLIEQAKILENLGVFSIVLECVPALLAKAITNRIKIPTIGIGAGKYCDGQVLVLYDLLGLYNDKRPRFVRVYRDLSLSIKGAIHNFKKDIKTGKFPAEKESFSIDPNELKGLI